MFGNLGAFVNGNMFMGLFGPAIGLKLAPVDVERLRAVAGTGPFGPPERPRAGWGTRAGGAGEGRPGQVAGGGIGPTTFTVRSHDQVPLGFGGFLSAGSVRLAAAAIATLTAGYASPGG